MSQPESKNQLVLVKMRAPKTFTEIHPDFAPLIADSKKQAIVCAIGTWPIAIAVFVFCCLPGPVPIHIVGVLFGLFMLSFPFFADMEAGMKREHFRFYTWVYRTTTPVRREVRCRCHMSAGDDAPMYFRIFDIYLNDKEMITCEDISRPTESFETFTKEYDVYSSAEGAPVALKEPGPDPVIWVQETTFS